MSLLWWGVQQALKRTGTRVLLAVFAAIFGLLILCSSGCGGTTCDPDQDLVVIDGEITRGISQCAACERVVIAYDARATILGCGDTYPLDGCPIDEGMTDCLVRQADLVANFVAAAESCGELQLRAGTIENYGGIECGARCTWSDPYANPVTSTTTQPPPREIAGGWRDHHVCAPGTPYGER